MQLFVLLMGHNFWFLGLSVVFWVLFACFPIQVHPCTLRFMLFNCNLFNYMLLWFVPLALILFFFTMYASCLATRNVWG